MSTSIQPPSSRRWVGLALIAAAQFIVIMDTSIIGPALPEIGSDLGFSAEKLSDVVGARRVFSLGWVVLIAGSLLAGLAGNVTVELVGRAAQGAGAAPIAPSALTLLFMLFGSSLRELTRALALYGAAAPAGGTSWEQHW